MMRNGVHFAGCVVMALAAATAIVWAADPGASVWPDSLAWARTAPQFYVAPDGKADAAGTADAPWDVVSALSGAHAIAPGSVVWLRGGTYQGILTCKLQGSDESPIIVRAYPGERVTFDSQAKEAQSCSFYATGQNVWYWGIELTNTLPDAESRGGIEPKGGRQQKYVNMVLHDVGNSSIGGREEVYGCLFNCIGVEGTNQCHPIYCQNNDPAHPFPASDSIICNSYAFGVHAYAAAGCLRGIFLEGNVWFGNGSAQSKPGVKDNCLVGSQKNPPEGIVLKDNMGWAKPPTGRSVALGRYNDKNIDITLIGNTFVGDTQFTNVWQKVTMTGNTFYPPPTGSVDLAQYPDNVYVKEQPTKNVVFVRPNAYEPGRALVAVYNWEGLDAAPVDLSSVVKKGDRFEVRNGQNFFAAPVASGVYDGGAVPVPLTGLEPAQPLRGGKIEPSEQTGKDFNVFVVLSGAGCLAGK